MGYIDTDLTLITALTTHQSSFPQVNCFNGNLTEALHKSFLFPFLANHELSCEKKENKTEHTLK